jgi:hypothetical protein
MVIPTTVFKLEQEVEFDDLKDAIYNNQILSMVVANENKTRLQRM